MKRVFVSLDGGEHALVASLLDAAGIPFQTRNEQVAAVLPTAPFGAEIWVAEDRFEEAAKLIEASLRSGGDETR